MAEFALYSYFRSSASYRARIALNLKGLSYDYVAVHLLNNGGEQRRAEYTKLNPSEQVPTLIHQTHAIGQSVAILDYLDHIRPEPRLFPQEALLRARVLQVVEIINSGIQPLHNLTVLQDLEKFFGADEAQKTAWTRHVIGRGVEILENFLRTTAGTFCFGDVVSAADCFLIPHLANVDRFQVSLAQAPTLVRIRATCEKLKAFSSAAPGVQPDAPPPGSSP